MKNLKLAIVAFALVFISCKSDDDRSPILADILTTISADVDAILSLPTGEDDITDLVTFGQPTGVSSGDWLVELAKNQTLKFEQPVGLLPGDVLLYSRVDYFDIITGDLVPSALVDPYMSFTVPTDAVFEDDPFFPPASGNNVVNKFDLTAIEAAADTDMEWKYNIRCLIKRGGIVIPKYFYIDPKIKINSSN